MSIVLKITSGSDIRRLTLKNEPTYTDLVTLIKHLYATDIPAAFVIKYLDDENDKISLTNDRELAEAWEFARTHGAILRVTILDKLSETTKPCEETKGNETETEEQQQDEAKPSSSKNALEELVDHALNLPEVQSILGALNLDPEVIKPTIDNFLEAFNPPSENPNPDAAKATTEESSKEDKIVHPAICDACNHRIVGIRYKCTACADYDLCEACEPKSQTVHDPTHTFLKIRRPTGPHPFFRHHPSWSRGGHGQAGCRRSFVGHPGMWTGAPGSGNGMGCHGRRRRCWQRWRNFQDQQQSGQPTGQQSMGCPFVTPKYQSRFIADVTVDDGTQFIPGTPFVKIWKMKNIGSTAWPDPTCLVFVGGDVLTDTEVVLVPAIQPNEEVDITVDMVAPTSQGRYVSKFRLCTPDGSRFGHCVWADITVVEGKVEVVIPQEEEVVEAAQAAEEEQELIFELDSDAPAPTPAPAAAAAPTLEEPKKTEEQAATPVQEEEKKEDEEGPMRETLDQLAAMGFANRELNLRLLKTYNGDILLTVHQLLSL